MKSRSASFLVVVGGVLLALVVVFLGDDRGGRLSGDDAHEVMAAEPVPDAGTGSGATTRGEEVTRTLPQESEPDSNRIRGRLLEWASSGGTVAFGPESSYWRQLEKNIETLRQREPEWQVYPFLTPVLITERFPPELQQEASSTELSLLTFAERHDLVERDDFLPANLRPEDLRSLGESSWFQASPPQWLAAYPPFFGRVSDDAILEAMPRLVELRIEYLRATLDTDTPMWRLRQLAQGNGDPELTGLVASKAGAIGLEMAMEELYERRRTALRRYLYGIADAIGAEKLPPLEVLDE